MGLAFPPGRCFQRVGEAEKKPRSWPPTHPPSERGAGAHPPRVSRAAGRRGLPGALG